MVNISSLSRRDLPRVDIKKKLYKIEKMHLLISPSISSKMSLSTEKLSSSQVFQDSNILKIET